MLDQTLTLPEDPEELRSFTARLLEVVKAQAILIEKLRHQLAGHQPSQLTPRSWGLKVMQMAIEQGVFSPNVVVQRIALKGYFDTLPAVIIQFTGEEAANEESSHFAVTQDLNGSVIANNGGSFTLTLDQCNSESRCYEGVDYKTDVTEVA